MTWELLNNTPYPAGYAFLCDVNGAEFWVVAIKGTFAIDERGEPHCHEEQVPLDQAPRHRDGPVESSLLHDMDFTITKHATDVLVQGHAYAPPGMVARSLDTGIAVGPIRKLVRVHGDRFWGWRMGKLTAGQTAPFERMEIMYERAYGGCDPVVLEAWDERNPVGRGFTTRAEHLDGQPLPNIEDPAHPVTSWRDRPPPAGLGPIARHWLPRRHLAGTYDEAWERNRLPLPPMDFNPRFWQSAPVDQQVPGFLKGGEAVHTLNLTPQGRWSFVLPQVKFRLRTEMSGEVVRHTPVLHTLLVEPDLCRIVLVWQAALSCTVRAKRVVRTRVEEA
jgi:hypothetical protein